MNAFRVYTGGDFQQTNSAWVTYTVTGASGSAATTDEVWSNWNDAVAGWTPLSGAARVAIGSVEDVSASPATIMHNGMSEVFAFAGALPDDLGLGIVALTQCFPVEDSSMTCLNTECDLVIVGLMATEYGPQPTDLTTNAIAVDEQMSLSLLFEHELGHILGIDHTERGIDSVMATGQERPQSFRTPTSSDLQMSIVIYGQ